jgi:hypothetical protein
MHQPDKEDLADHALANDEESDSCGDLPLSSIVVGGQQTIVDGRRSFSGDADVIASTETIVQRRSSEFYPIGRQPMTGPFGRQARRDRRLSDPGRLAVPLLRLSLHQQAAAAAAAAAAGEYSTNGGGSPQPGVRLSDPRLAAIRSLFSSGPCEVGEALAAPSLQSTANARSPRSRSPTSPSEQTAQQQQRHARWDTRRLSLPNPQPLQQSLGVAGRPPVASWLLPTEVNEAMGAVSGSPSAVAAGVSFPMCGSPPLTRPGLATPAAAVAQTAGSSQTPPTSAISAAAPLLCGSTAASAASALRRRRSVSLDQSGGSSSMRLEAITEENSAAGAASRTGHGGSATSTSLPTSRKSSTPLATLSYD